MPMALLTDGSSRATPLRNSEWQLPIVAASIGVEHSPPVAVRVQAKFAKAFALEMKEVQLHSAAVHKDKLKGACPGPTARSKVCALHACVLMQHLSRLPDSVAQSLCSLLYTAARMRPGAPLKH